MVLYLEKERSSRPLMKNRRIICTLAGILLLLTSPVAWGCESTDMASCQMSACPMSAGGTAGRRRALEGAGVGVQPVRSDGGRVSVDSAVEALGARGMASVMVEGGSEVLGSFLAARLVDQVALFRAPLLLGGRGSRPAFGGPDPAEIGDALRLAPALDPSFPWPWPPRFELWAPRRGSRSH